MKYFLPLMAKRVVQSGRKDAKNSSLNTLSFTLE